MNHYRIFQLFIVFAFLLFVSACTPIDTPKPQDAQYAQSVDQLRELLAQSSSPVGGERAVLDSMERMESGSSAPAQDSRSIDYSTTNVRTPGIDESDIIKTDGQYVYTASDKTLYIISAGEQASILYEHTYNYSITSLLIEDDQLIVFFSDHTYTPNWQFIQTTFMHTYDVSDRRQPILEDTLELEGSLIDARLFEGTVYITSQDRPTYHRPMPLLRVNDVQEDFPVSSIRIFPTPYTNPSLVSVLTFDLDTRNIEISSVLTEGFSQIYMSEQNLYIFESIYISQYQIQQEFFLEQVRPHLTRDDRDLIERIFDVDDDILSRSEKEQKNQQVYAQAFARLDSQEREQIERRVEELTKEKIQTYESLTQTTIHRMDIHTLEVQATNTFAGQLSNQFAIDEHEQVLRVAMTLPTQWFQREQTQSENRVLTLDMQLDELARIGNIAPGESIFSARFMENRLYLVTFEQIDPFFVIDLEDPYNPTILGELKIPGFSRYLHPYDQNHIIGIGRQATETGRQQGIKVSLFNVQDVENPQEVQTFVASDDFGYSSAEFEPHAFLFSKQKELLVIPYSSWQDRQYGAYVFEINPDTIELRGLIDHGQSVERSLYIEDLLYTKSPSRLRIHRIDTLDAVGDILLSRNDVRIV
ncbi:MAG: beta-propeller domain-containing protein [Candidatus Woesearchaeota archaeon]